VRHGFLVNDPKSELDPKTRLEALGFILDTGIMCYDIPQRRKE